MSKDTTPVYNVKLKEKVEVKITEKYASQFSIGMNIYKAGETIMVNPSLVDRLIANGMIETPKNWTPIFSKAFLDNKVGLDGKKVDKSDKSA